MKKILEDIKPSTSVTKRTCRVCGGGGAGLHYGGIVCTVCRVFFLRQTKREFLSHCKADGKCEILPGAHDNCKSCRYQKCLSIGMVPYEVGKGNLKVTRQIVTNFTNYESGKKMLEITSSFSAGFHMVQALEESSTALEFARNLLHLQKFSFNTDETTFIEESDEPCFSNVHVSLADVIMNSQACSNRSMKIMGLWRVKAEQVYSLTQTHCRGVTMYADFLTAAPEIHLLNSVDKLKVIQYNYLSTQLFTFFYDIWLRKIDENSLRSRPNRYKLPPGEQALVNNLISRMMASIKQIYSFFESHHVQEEEMVILKLLILFTTPPEISTEGFHRIRSARTKYSILLSRLTKSLNPYASDEDSVERVYRLLHIRRLMEGASELVHQVYTGLYVSNADGIAGALTYDLFLRKYQ